MPTDTHDETIVRGTANVFADLGYADADDRQLQLGLAQALNATLARRRLTQAAAHNLMGIDQPKVSQVAGWTSAQPSEPDDA